MAATKTEGGVEFPAEAYAYVPDAKTPSTWKLRLWESPAKKATAAQVGRAVAALGKGFRGQKVEIPEADRAAAMAKVRAAWKSTHPGAKPADMPAMMKEAATTELSQIGSLVYDELQETIQGDSQPGDAGYKPFGTEALFPDRVIVCMDGRYYSYPYTIDDNNKVTLGKPQEVLESFEPVGAGAEAMTEALGSDTVFVEAVDPEGKVWDAVLIRAGLAKNGDKTFYPDATLRESAPLFEGARVFARGDIEHRRPDTGNDINKLVGWISEPRFVEGNSPDTGYLAGRLNFAAGATALRETIADAWKRGKRDLVGLSIDARGKAAAATRGAAKRIAQSIVKVNSVDLIVEPSAGGGLVRLVESAATEEKDPMKDRLLAVIKEKRPDLFAKLGTTPSEEQIEAAFRESLVAQPGGGDQPVTREELRMVEARAHARTAIAAAALPVPAKDKLQKRFDGLSRFTEADVEAEIKAEREYLARFTESGHVRMPALELQVEDRSKKIAGMLDAFFDEKHKDHRAAQSFKECYVEITGDMRVTGRLEHMDRSRMAESIGAAFKESLDSTSFGNVLGDSITRRMVADYRDMGQYDIWRQAAEVVPVSDFRTQDRVRFGGYGDLATVTQGNPYLAVASPSDEQATYAVAKRGGTEDITLEMIKNDDVGSIRRIPVKLSRSAKRTLAKFVLDFVRTNPTIYDSVAFFHASHGNLGSTALAAAEISVARTAMLKQAEAGSNDRLGIGPKYIWVPPDLQDVAWTAFQRNTNLDKTFTQQLNLEIMPVWYWTDVTDWALSADINDIPGIEIGFLDGQQEPELFVQDMPNVGSMFSNDKLTYKIRHIYGGAVKEYRGWYKEVVAG